LPVGLNLVARAHQEEHLLGAAQWLQESNVVGSAKRPRWAPPQRG
jgi:Asp-tRNA(Asn)/Glu-tRNA(Gln) amidotransferase A subunit family amidase